VTVRWLVTGTAGLLGAEVVATLGRVRPADAVTAADRAGLDLDDDAAVRAAVPGHDVVVSCAAWTDVDAAESSPAAQRAAMAVNARAAGRLAVACRAAGARILHLSTDYVFDGTASTPYREDAPPRPASVYGATKLAGEWAVLAAGGQVVRTAWLHDGDRGRSFVATMAARARAGRTAVVVADQTGQPTWVRPLAERLVAIGTLPDRPRAPRVLHATCTGQTTWYALAREVYRLCGADPELVAPTTSAAIATTRPAPRPAYAVLADSRTAGLGLAPMPHWLDALAAAVAPRPV
jgi:dTDP-4-dehydrorhamnose reductase